MNTHTPTPWTIERDGTTLCMGNQHVAQAIAPDGASLAEQRANARLIAAAPELYEALHELLAALDDSATSDDSVQAMMRYAAAEQDARAALAKVSP
jgi:hypothetical protein